MKTDIPPEGEDPVRVSSAIRWRNATATVAISEVLFFSTGVYFQLDYRMAAEPSPPRSENREDRRRIADEATERARARLQLTARITVNGARAVSFHPQGHDRGFTAWIWSAFPVHPDAQPATAALIQLNSPDFPGADAAVPYPPPGSPTAPADHPVVRRAYLPPQGEDPVVVRPEIAWRSETATITIPEVYFYSAGAYLPVTCRPLAPVPPARAAGTDEEGRLAEANRLRARKQVVEQVTVNGTRAEPRRFHSSDDWLTFTGWIWIEAGEPQGALHVELNRPEFPGAEAIISYPPPGAPTTPAPGVPQSWTDSGDGWSQATAVLRSSHADVSATGEAPA